MNRQFSVEVGSCRALPGFVKSEKKEEVIRGISAQRKGIFCYTNFKILE